MPDINYKKNCESYLSLKYYKFKMVYKLKQNSETIFVLYTQSSSYF